MQKIRQLFNFRLYLEGLKKIKLIGIAALIVTVALCAIIPIIYIADGAGYREDVTSISINHFAMPLGVIMAFAPFFISSMFSYLNVRRDSDFYHAIPYKRQSVYTSFLLAALTWCLGIITAAVLACAVLWSLAPRTTFELYYVPLLIAAAFCCCLMLMAFMSLAMSLTGTATTNVFIFGLVTCFFRVVCLLFTNALKNTVYILDLSETFLRFTDISFFFPIAFLGGSFGIIEASEVYTNIPLYIYTVAVSVGMLLLALWLYVRRRSEMATKSAPSKRLQHVYRIAFTTPFVLLMFTFIAIELMGNDSMDISFYIFMCLVIGIVYFLYELITTKSPKNMLKATPYLSILLVLGCLFVGAIGIVRTSVLSNVYNVEQIQSVTFNNTSSNIYTSDKDYETMKTGKIEISDSAVLKYVADALEYSVDSVYDGTYPDRRVLVGIEGGKDVYEKYMYATVSIRLKDGRRIGRKLKFTEDDYAKMLKCAQNTEEYARAYLEIPELDSIYSIYWNRIEGEKMRFIYETFYEEYMLMTDEQKREVKNIDASQLRYQIECYGRENFTEYCFNMKISQKTPKTLNAFAAAMAELEVQDPSAAENTELSSYEAAKKLIEMYADTDGKFFSSGGNEYTSISFNLSLALFGADGQSVGSFYADGTSSSKSQRGVKYLCKALSDGSIRTRYSEGDCIITLDVYYYRSDVKAIYTEKDSYTYITEPIHVSTQLILFCDSEIAEYLEMYVDKDEVYYYYSDDVVVKEDYYG